MYWFLFVQCVWAMTCVTVTHTVACPVYPSQDRTPVFRLPALSTDSFDESSGAHDMLLPPLARVIDVERYLDMDGVGKRPGEIRVQVCDYVFASVSMRPLEVPLRVVNVRLEYRGLALPACHSALSGSACSVRACALVELFQYTCHFKAHALLDAMIVAVLCAIQLLEARSLVLAKHVNRVYCIARLGRREVQGMYHLCKAVASTGIPWKEVSSDRIVLCCCTCTGYTMYRAGFHISMGWHGCAGPVTVVITLRDWPLS